MKKNKNTALCNVESWSCNSCCTALQCLNTHTHTHINGSFQWCRTQRGLPLLQHEEQLPPRLHISLCFMEKNKTKHNCSFWAADGNLMETLSPSQTTRGKFGNIWTINLTSASQFGSFDVCNACRQEARRAKHLPNLTYIALFCWRLLQKKHLACYKKKNNQKKVFVKSCKTWNSSKWSSSVLVSPWWWEAT